MTFRKIVEVNYYTTLVQKCLNNEQIYYKNEKEVALYSQCQLNKNQRDIISARGCGSNELCCLRSASFLNEMFYFRNFH